MKCLILLVLLYLPYPARASDIYPFNTYAQQERFTELTQQLRCLVCQNQNLYDSNAPLAQDLRQIIYEQIQNNFSNQEIIQFLLKRYGTFILYRPPFNWLTLGLWIGPFIILILSVGSLLFYIIKNNTNITKAKKE